MKKSLKIVNDLEYIPPTEWELFEDKKYKNWTQPKNNKNFKQGQRKQKKKRKR